jgi:hypothetical protein
MKEIGNTHKECSGVKTIVLPMLALVRRSLVTLHGNSQLRALLTTAEFAENLAKLVGSPHLMERDDAISTILISITSIREISPGLLSRYVMLVLNVVTTRMSGMLQKPRDILDKDLELFKACLPLVSISDIVDISDRLFLLLTRSPQTETVFDAMLNALECPPHNLVRTDALIRLNIRDRKDMVDV